MRAVPTRSGWRAGSCPTTSCSTRPAARRADRLGGLAHELGDGVVPIAADVAVDDDCERLVRTTVDRFGRIDVLVNNAGTSDLQPAESEPIDAFRRAIDVNLTGLFL